MRVQPVGLGRRIRQGLHGEDQPAAGRQRVRGGRGHARQVAEVAQRVGRDDQLPRRGGRRGDERRQLALGKLVVHLPRLGLGQHAGRQVHAVQVPRIGRQQGAAQARAAACVQHPQRALRHPGQLGHPLGHQRRRLVVQPRQLGVEALGEAVEHRFHVVVGRALRHGPAGAGRQVVQRLGVAGFVLQPLAVHARRLLHPAELPVGHAHQLACLAVARRMHQRLPEGADAFLRASGAHQQRAEVGVGIREVGLELQGAAIGGLRLGQPALLAQQRTQVVVQLGTLGRQGLRARVGRGGLVQPVRLQQHVAQVAVPVGHGAVFGDRLLHERDRLVAAAALVAQHPQEVQHVGVARLHPQQGLVDLPGRVPAALAVPGDGQLQRLLGAQFGGRRGSGGGLGNGGLSVHHVVRAVAAGPTSGPCRDRPARDSPPGPARSSPSCPRSRSRWHRGRSPWWASGRGGRSGGPASTPRGATSRG